MVKVLAFDVSSKSTGYATLSNKRLLKRGYGTIKTNPKHTVPQKLVYFRDQAEILIRKHKPDVIVIEDVFVGGNKAVTILLSRFSGVIMELCSRLGYSPVLITVPAVRSAIGVKNKKELVYEFIVKKYKLRLFSFKTHNDITDAIALGLAGSL